MSEKISPITMTVSLLLISCFLLLVSCKDTQKQENATARESVEKTVDEIVTTTSTDKDGKKLEMSFNNTKNIATLHFNGETIELVGQKPASGIWYKNDNYELTGKGDSIVLKKDGKTVFEY